MIVNIKTQLTTLNRINGQLGRCMIQGLLCFLESGVGWPDDILEIASLKFSSTTLWYTNILSF